MKNLIPLTLAGMLVAMPALANKDHMSDSAKSDHWFSKMDTNGDGMITKSEHEAFGNKMFREADSNNDNMISRDEMRAEKERTRAEYSNSRDQMSPSAGIRERHPSGASTNSDQDTIHNRKDNTGPYSK